eukprot:3421034-Pyramimonas_sp.AAC.2
MGVTWVRTPVRVFVRVSRLRASHATVSACRRPRTYASTHAQFQPFSLGCVGLRSPVSRNAVRAFDSALSLPSVQVGDGAWDGLPAYRAREQDMGWKWGEKGPTQWDQYPIETLSAPAQTLADCGREVLLTADPLQKALKSHAAVAAFLKGMPLGMCHAYEFYTYSSVGVLLHCSGTTTVTLNVHAGWT